MTRRDMTRRDMTRRDMTRRDPWAILYASLIFGGLAIPYCYLALNIAVILLINFPLHLGLFALFLLGASTAVLLLVFIARTPLERRLSQRLGRLFPLLRAILIVLAAGYLVVDILASMNPFPLMLPVASWSDFITIAAITTVAAMVVVLARPPSRLERAIATKLDRDNPWYRAYRGAGYVALLSRLLFVGYWLNQYYLYSRYCGGDVVEQQDYIDCHFR
jgi:hypothetical protein